MKMTYKQLIAANREFEDRQLRTLGRIRKILNWLIALAVTLGVLLGCACVWEIVQISKAVCRMVAVAMIGGVA